MRSSIAYVVCILLLHNAVVRASPVQGTAFGDGRERRGRDPESSDEEDVKKERGTAQASLQAALERRRVDECLLISLANGRLVALDKDSGELLWTFDTGGPLVSSNINAQQNDAGTKKGEHQGQEAGENALAFPNEGIFPGTDGSLYTYQGGFDGGAPRIHRLPVGIRELVDASPSPAPDGTMLLGTQQSIVFVLDVANGNVLQTIRGDEVGEKTSAFMSDPESLFENYDDIYEDNDGQFLDSIDDADVDRSESRGKRRVFITIGRKDYVIKAIHPAFGEQWNVSYGSLQRLSSLDVRRSGEGDLHVEVAGHHHGRADQTDEKGHAYHFRVGADNSLGRYDLVGRERMWISKFDAPPLVAYPPHGDPIDLLATTSFENGKDDAMDAMTSSSKDFQESVASVDGGTDSQHFRHKIKDASAGTQLNSNKNGESQNQEETLVIGFMGGGLYGMRASPGLLTYRSEDTCASSAEDDVHTLTRRASSLVPHTESPYHMSKMQRETVSNRENSASSTALVVRNTADLFTIPLWQKAVCSSSYDGVCAVPFGLFSVEQDTCENSQLVYLPSAPAKPPGPLSPHRGNAQSLLLQGTRFLRRRMYWFGGSDVDKTTSFDEIDFLITLIGLLMAWASLLVVLSVFRRRTKPSISSKAALKESAADAIRSDPGHQKDEYNGTTTMPQHLLEDGDTIPDGTLSTTSNDETFESLRERGRDHLRTSSSERRMLSDGSFRVGRLRVGPKVLGYGSGGTVVFEGQLDGRSVAVKRLLRQFVDLAKKEIEALIDSDEHPNVVRCFAMEEDAEFVYLALERCVCTLADVVSIRLRNDRSLGSEEGFDEAGVRPSLGAPPMELDLPEEWCLVNKDGEPTPWALQIAENVGRGLAALHARGIVHRDVKPHNVLLTKSGQAKLSDMGLSKRLVPEQASFETAGGAGGSPGWQAPEQLTVRAGGQGRLTAAVDVFSFGLLTYYCLTGGKHPFGEGYERDAAILRGQRNLDGLQEGEQSEARDLVVAALAPAPEDRPPMGAVLGHPLWWPIERRLSFLIDVSDTVEGEDRVEDSVLYVALELLSKLAIGKDGEGIWSTRLDAELLSNLGKYRRYDYTSLRDLLRVIRNKHSHYQELPLDLQAKLGPVPEGFYRYFASRFPRLLCICFYFALRWCHEKPRLVRYFPTGTVGLLTSALPIEIRDPDANIESLATARKRLFEQHIHDQLGQRSPLIPTSGIGVHESPVTVDRAPNDGIRTPHDKVGASADLTSPGSSLGLLDLGPVLKVPIGLRTPTTGSVGLEPLAPPIAIVPDGLGGRIALFPRRPGAPLCEFYVRSGHCRFGETCKFDHPPEFAVKLNGKGLPVRPGEQICSYWRRNGECKFGPACKFHHPM